jgi:hypothetical protein
MHMQRAISFFPSFFVIVPAFGQLNFFLFRITSCPPVSAIIRITEYFFMERTSFKITRSSHSCAFCTMFHALLVHRLAAWTPWNGTVEFSMIPLFFLLHFNLLLHIAQHLRLYGSEGSHPLPDPSADVFFFGHLGCHLHLGLSMSISRKLV